MSEWTPSEKTDIRETFVKNWPVGTRDEVYQRMKNEIELSKAFGVFLIRGKK